MSLFIEKIHNVFADLEGKNVATKHPPERIDRVLYLIVVDIFNKQLDHYVKTSKISNYLLPFKRQVTLTFVGGVVDLPGDFAHHRQFYVGGKKVDIIEDKFWDGRANSKLSPPSVTSPIVKIENSESATPARKLEVLPTTITTGKLLYFKYPREPKYAYTKTGTRYFYDEANSVDVEFPIGLYPDIVVRLLSNFGIVLREAQMMQIAEQLKTQDQAK